MKALLSACLAFLSICTCAQPYTFTSLSEMGIKGKVKTITHEKFESFLNKELNEVVVGRVPALNNFRIQFFNPDGLIEKQESYAADQFTEKKVLNHLDKYEYENGRLVYQLNGDVHGQRMYPGNKGIEYKYIYESDSVILVLCLDPHYFHERYTILENEHTYERLYSDMKVHSTEKTLFDVYGRKILFTVLSSEGDPTSLTQWVYADKNDPNPACLIKTDVKTPFNTICRYQYNHLNQLVSGICREHSGNTEKTYSYQCEYNVQGDLILESFQESPADKRKTYAYQFTYDHHGNWVEKKFFGSSGQTGNIHRRTFTYWDE